MDWDALKGWDEVMGDPHPVLLTESQQNCRIYHSGRDSPEILNSVSMFSPCYSDIARCLQFGLGAKSPNDLDPPELWRSWIIWAFIFRRNPKSGSEHPVHGKSTDLNLDGNFATLDLAAATLQGLA